jgi:V/A-type H+-transporting ATPase subunit A
LADWWYERDIDWSEIDIDWIECRKQVNEILSQERQLKYVIQLVGERNLPESQQLILFISRLIKNGFLIQSAFDDIDNYTNVTKLLGMIKMILLIYKEGKILVDQGVLIENLIDPDLLNAILRINNTIPNEDFRKIETLKKRLVRQLKGQII